MWQSDAGASAGNDDDLVGFFCHDFPPENVVLVRVYRIAGAAVYTDSRIVEKYRNQLAQIFTQIGLSFLHSQCQLALEIETLRKYTILY